MPFIVLWRYSQVDWVKIVAQAYCDVSRLIKEMKLDEGDAVPTDDEIITLQNRLANLKALLSRPKE